MGFAVANQIALIVVLTVARGAGIGAVSAYQYAFIFFQLPYGLIAVSLMTAVLPERTMVCLGTTDRTAVVVVLLLPGALTTQRMATPSSPAEGMKV